MRQDTLKNWFVRLGIVFGIGLCAWTNSPAQSLTWLGTLGGGRSAAYGVSADGSVVVGWAEDVSGQPRAFRWESGAMQDLGTLGGNHSAAYGVSADGSVVVGWAEDVSGQQRAFRWANGVMQDLGTLGLDYSIAYGVSADGGVVVGGAFDNSRRSRAFRWKNSTMQDLNVAYASLLQDGSELYFATAVSFNGRYIVGYGYNATTDRIEGYLLDTVPEPSTLTTLLMGAAAIPFARRKRRA